MAKRLFDIVFAALVLVLCTPVFLFAAAGIKVSDWGPVFFRARRSGKNGVEFEMYKFRTMRQIQTRNRSAITADQDVRIYPFGKFLRRSKIDELPQFINVLLGDMSVVGPRPEDPDIVARYYTPIQLETLNVAPGIASPGSIYNYTIGERLITGADPEQVYAERVLPVKLALEIVYVRTAGFLYDIRLIARTVATILAVMLGKRDFSEPTELITARKWGLCT